MRDLEINDPEFVNSLHNLIKKMVQSEIKKTNIPKSWVARVVSVSGDTAVVKLAGTDTNLSAKMNKTGETLSTNDEVYLYSPTGNLSNSYIDVKK